MNEIITIDFKVIAWERCLISKNDAETVLEALKNGEITDSNSLYDFAVQVEWETFTEVVNQMTVEENGGEPTIVAFNKNMNVIWDNSKQKNTKD